MTGAAVLELIDAAPAFAEPRALAGDELRRAGLAAIDQEIQRLRAAEGDARAAALEEAARQAGSIAAAGAIDEKFAKALLEDAAAGVRLVKDLGARAVKAAIATAIKAGKKTPRDFSEHPLMLSHPRPGEAGNSADVRTSSFPADVAAAARPPDGGAADLPTSSPASAGFSEQQASSQMGASDDNWPAAGGKGGDRQQPDDGEDEDERHIRLAQFPMTDLGNAERFFARNKGRLLWCAAFGWLVWDGKRYSRNGADSAVMIAEHDTVRLIQEEARAIFETGLRDQVPGGQDYVWAVVRKQPILFSERLAQWGRESESVNKLGALSKRGEPYFAIGLDQLDADKFKVNVNNGTLVIRKSAERDYVQFKPHDRADLITKLMPVDYDPAAECPQYLRFIERIQPAEANRSFLHQWFGLSLTGDVTEQKLAFFYGKGGNGKSVLIDLMSYIAGDYGETVPIETFLDHGRARGAGQATPDLAILPGKRMLRTSEPEKGAKLAEAMVKLVTGGEQILARDLNRPFFRFYPQFKLTMSGNYRPQISGADEGIWRRMQLVPFNVIIPKEERDRHLIDKLRAEASGVLNLLLDGLRIWLDKGLQVPEEVVQATAAYRAASDPLGRFLSICVVASTGDRVQSSSLYALYEAWCAAASESAWKQRGFSLAMEERGYRKKHSDVVWWLDIKVVKAVNDFVDHEGKPLRARDDQKKEDDGGDIEI